MSDGIRESMGMSPWQQVRSSDSEATRAAGMTSAENRRDFEAVCAHCSLPLEKSNEDNRKDWRHTGSGSVFCKKKRGMTLMEATPRKQHRPMRENLEDLMRDTTDAVSGDKPHIHVFDSDVLPMQFGENLSPGVERYNSLFCACGNVAHFGTWIPKQGEPKVCADCRDYEQNIRSWIEELGGDASSEHISLTLESLLRASNAEVGRLREEREELRKHLHDLRKCDPDWQENQATEADAMGGYESCVEYHESQRDLLRAYINGFAVIVIRAEYEAANKTSFAAGQQKGREECLGAVDAMEVGNELVWKNAAKSAILALPKVGE